MKISFNWLCDYIDTSCTIAEVSDILTAIGLEVESTEKFESIPGGLHGVVVGEVLECIKHPAADKLKLTKVQIGEDEILQIVCGAPNVAAGQKVLVATVGTKLMPTNGESITIKKGKIRGQESHGMICAEDEIGLGNSHEGIMVLDAKVNVGMTAAAYLNIKEDHCIEIGLTPNRTDAFSHYGVARDLAAALRNMVGIKNESATLRLPSVSAFKFEQAADSSIEVEVTNTHACPRYCGLLLEGIKVEPSPKWMQERLSVVGLLPINNVVDITNYVQLEMGQPLHAFDAQQIEGKKIIVRLANLEEKFTTLDGVDRSLDENDLVICDTKKPLCIAGVYGGKESGVNENSTSIFLESACFNPVFIRKTSKRHGLKTDASFRFERGTDMSATMWALQRAALLIIENAGGKIVNAPIDIYPKPANPAEVQYNWKRAASLIGHAIEKEKVKSILHDLEITVNQETNESMNLGVPLYRSDVQREADVVEEVLRIFGYNNIEIPTRMHSSMSAAPKPDIEKIQNKIAGHLTANGFHEMMNMSLSRSKYLDLLNDDEIKKEDAIEILNPLSRDLGILRQTMLFSGMEAVALNQNHRNTNIRCYEFGKIYSKNENQYHEENRLSIFMTGKRNIESWNTNSDDVSFSDMKAVVEQILKALGVRKFSYASSSSTHFSDAMEIFSNTISLGKLGIIAPHILNEFDVKQNVLFTELNWDNLIKALSKQPIQYKEADKFPAVRRDLSLLMQKEIKYSDIERVAFETDHKLLRGINLFDVYEGKNIETNMKSYAISFVLQDATKTMNDQQVETAMNRIQKAIEEKLRVTLRN